MPCFQPAPLVVIDFWSQSDYNTSPMKSMCLLSLLLSASLVSVIAEPQQSLPLWPDGAPGALGKSEKDIPSLTPYPAAGPNISGAAMVILPGAGYGMLAPHEGPCYASWLATNGNSWFALNDRHVTER